MVKISIRRKQSLQKEKYMILEILTKDNGLTNPGLPSVTHQMEF